MACSSSSSSSIILFVATTEFVRDDVELLARLVTTCHALRMTCFARSRDIPGLQIKHTVEALLPLRRRRSVRARISVRNAEISLSFPPHSLFGDAKKILSERIHLIPCLGHLSVFSNSVGDKYASCFADFAKRLVTLQLPSNAIGDLGGYAIAHAALGPGSRLKTLNLRDNDLGRRTGDALGRMLKLNETLTTLYLDQNEGIGESLGLFDALRSSTLNALGLADTAMTNKGFARLAAALKANDTTSWLNCSNNLITEHLVISFAPIITLPTRPTALYIAGNHLTARAARALADSRRENQYVDIIDVPTLRPREISWKKKKA